MAKRPKQLCEHGNKPIKADGCAYCIMQAFAGLNVTRHTGATMSELYRMLLLAYPTKESFEAGLQKAKAYIADLELIRKANAFDDLLAECKAVVAMPYRAIPAAIEIYKDFAEELGLGEVEDYESASKLVRQLVAVYKSAAAADDRLSAAIAKAGGAS